MKTLNCMIIDDDEVCRSILSHYIKKTDNLVLIYSTGDAIEGYNILKKDAENIDILFLDIEMPEMTGFDILKAMEENMKKYIILTTSREQYAVEAFELNVDDYLLKPINYPRFVKAIEKVQKKASAEEAMLADEIFEHSTFFVRSKHSIIKIVPEDIYFVEALSEYILVYTLNPDYPIKNPHEPLQKFVVYGNMKSFDEKMEKYKFLVRVHRSYLVNLNKLDKIHDSMVYIRGEEIPIGKHYKENLMSKLNILK